MTETTDKVIPRHARGRRPHFFEDPSTDKLVAIVLELTQELSVLRERVDTLQRLLDQCGVLPLLAVENYVADDEAEAARADGRNDYLQRVFRVLRHQRGSFSPKDAETQSRQTEAELAAPSS